MEELIKQYEEIKAKWFRVTEQDALDLFCISDSLLDLYIENKSSNVEWKIQLDVEKAVMGLELKEETFNDSKTDKVKNYTEQQVKDKITIKTHKQKLDIEVKNITIEMLEKKYQQVLKYHDLIKKIVFKS